MPLYSAQFSQIPTTFKATIRRERFVGFSKAGYNYLMLYSNVIMLYFFQNLQIGHMTFNDIEYAVIFSSWSEGLINTASTLSPCYLYYVT